MPQGCLGDALGMAGRGERDWMVLDGTGWYWMVAVKNEGLKW